MDPREARRRWNEGKRNGKPTKPLTARQAREFPVFPPSTGVPLPLQPLPPPVRLDVRPARLEEPAGEGILELGQRAATAVAEVVGPLVARPALAVNPIPAVRRFARPSPETPDVLRGVLTGRISPAEAGRLLERQFTTRPLGEQLFVGAAGDPLNFVPGVGFVSKAQYGLLLAKGTLAAKAAGRAVAEVVPEVAPAVRGTLAEQRGFVRIPGGGADPAHSGLPQTDALIAQAKKNLQVARRSKQTEGIRQAAEALDDLMAHREAILQLELPEGHFDHLETLRRREGEIQALLTTRDDVGNIIRPPKNTPGGIGLWSDARLRVLADSEQVSPYADEWWDALDPVAIKDVRSLSLGGRPRAAPAQLRRELRQTREEIASIERGETMPVQKALSPPVPTAPPARPAVAPSEQIGAVQAGMGIGEAPTQGTLFEGLRGEAQALPLADQEALLARQARAAEILRGQAELPEAPPLTAVPPNQIPAAASLGAPPPPRALPLGAEMPPRLALAASLAPPSEIIPPTALPSAGAPPGRQVLEGEVIPPPRPPPVPPTSADVPVIPFRSPQESLKLPEPERAATLIPKLRKSHPDWFKEGLFGLKGAKQGLFDVVEQSRRMVLNAREVGDNTIAYVNSYIHIIGDPVKEFGIDAQGLVTKVGNPNRASLAWNDVLSNPTLYALTPTQNAIAKRQGAVYRAGLALARQYGVQVNELPKVDAFWQYIARRVKGKLNPATGEYEIPRGTVGAFRMGAKTSFQKERVLDQMLEGVDLGLLYENPDQTMGFYIKGLYRLIGNKQAEELIKPVTRQIPEGGVPFGMRGFQQPALSQRMAARELADAIDKIFTPETELAFFRKTAEVSGALVGQVAALDISWPLIQGLPYLGRDIKQALLGKPSFIWTRTYKDLLRYVREPESIHAFREARRDVYRQAIADGIITTPAEFTAGVTVPERVVGKVPKVGEPLARIHHETFGRFGQAYSNAAEEARILYYEQMAPIWARAGRDTREVAELANQMGGSVSAKARGVGANQRNIERTAVFAPNYIRAMLLVLGDAMGKDAKAREVQASLAAMLAAIVGSYIVVAKSVGQESKLNPLPRRYGGDGPDVLTFRVGNTRVGVGSWYYGMIKTLAEVGAIAADEPEALLRWNQAHPMVRWAKTKSSPISSFIQEMVLGRDFYGNEFTSGKDYLMAVIEKTLPIWSQSMLTQKPRGGPVQAAVEVTGARTFPVTQVSELRSAWRDDIQPYMLLPTNPVEARAKGVSSRSRYRDQHPDIEAKLFIAGQVSSLQTALAFRETVRLMKQYRLKLADIKAMEATKFESADKARLRQLLQQALGERVSAGATQPSGSPRPTGPTPLRPGEYKPFRMPQGQPTPVTVR